jgi:hypothetical protein
VGVIPAASAFRASSDQSIPDDAETPVVYNSDGYDTAGIHPDNINGDSRFTAPVGGIYFVRASVRWASGGGPDNRGTRRLKLRTNGGTNEATHEFAPDTNGLPLVHAVSTILPLRAGQFVEAVVKQTSGDDLDIALGVDSEFQMCWLAPFPL